MVSVLALRESDGVFKVEQLMGCGIGVKWGWRDRAESASTGDVSARSHVRNLNELFCPVTHGNSCCC